MADVAELCGGLLAVNANAAGLCEGLDEDQLRCRPDPSRWSIAENLIHLRTTTDIFLPMVDHALAETRRRELDHDGPFRLTWYGRLLVWYVEPPPVLRLPAPKKLRPRMADAAEPALTEFLSSQTAMLARMQAGEGLDLTALRFPSPLASYVRMNLMEFFSVFNGHSRRHVWQANNVRRTLLSARGGG